MNGIVVKNLLLVLLYAGALGGFTVQAPSASGVEFDFPHGLQCLDITPPGFTLEHPQHRVVEVLVPLSVRFHGKESKYVEELTADVLVQSKHVQVYAFSPETQLASELSSDIALTTTSERSRSLDATLGGGLPVAAGNLIAHVTPSISGGLGSSETSIESVSRRAPRRPIVVSGTTDRGSGVFFKLQRTSQTTLEGVHELTIAFVVPVDWVEGELYVHCVARGRHKLFGVVERPREFGECSSRVQVLLAKLPEVTPTATKIGIWRKSEEEVSADTRPVVVAESDS